MKGGSVVRRYRSKPAFFDTTDSACRRRRRFPQWRAPSTHYHPGRTGARLHPGRSPRSRPGHPSPNRGHHRRWRHLRGLFCLRHGRGPVPSRRAGPRQCRGGPFGHAIRRHALDSAAGSDLTLFAVPRQGTRDPLRQRDLRSIAKDLLRFAAIKHPERL